MTPKRGRKKGSKNTFYGEPSNLAFWKFELKNPETVNAFLERGSIQQKETIKDILKYLKRKEPDFFERINGQKIVKRLK